MAELDESSQQLLLELPVGVEPAKCVKVDDPAQHLEETSRAAATPAPRSRDMKSALEELLRLRRSFDGRPLHRESELNVGKSSRERLAKGITIAQRPRFSHADGDDADHPTTRSAKRCAHHLGAGVHPFDPSSLGITIRVSMDEQQVETPREPFSRSGDPLGSRNVPQRVWWVKLFDLADID